MPFIVYGCGVKTQTIIENTPDDVYGLMDSHKTGEIFCNKRVLSEEEVASSGIKKIVIAARKANVPIIYRRIAELCRANSIHVYDDEGVMLADSTSEIDFDFSLDTERSEEIKRKILSAEVISFDVFDTLIMRSCLYPDDIFEISGICVNNIDNNKIFEYEKLMTVPRKEIIEYYSLAINNDKEVYFCSDMYLKGAQIYKILTKCGVESKLENIIVSCDYSVEKTNGLFEVLKERVGNKNLLHIGDSYEADYQAAKKHGIDSVKIDTRLDVLERSKWSGLLEYDYSLDNRRVIGELLASDMSLADMASPLIYKFASWLKEQAKAFDLILLGSRDGWLIDIIRKKYEKYNFPAIYFLISRTAAVSSAIYNETDFNEAKQYPFSGTEKQMLENRFAMNKAKTASEAIQHSEKLRASYLKYIERLNIEDSARVGFMDLVSAGTCLKKLTSFAPFDIKGLFAMKLDGCNADVNCLYQSLPGGNILNNFLLLEEMLSSGMPTLKAFTENGEPIYFEEKRTPKQLADTKDIQEKILAYGKRTVDIDFTKVDLALCDKIFGMINTAPIGAEDEFCGR